MLARGHLSAYWLGAIVCIGGFLFGYDSGIIGGVLTFATFENDFGFTKAEKTRISSLCVSLQQLGAFVACLFIVPYSRKYGRKWSIIYCCLVFMVGAVLQTIPSHSLACFYVGRIVAGLGLGAMTSIVPMYNAEMAPRELRGRIGSFFQLFYTLGIFTSYWIDYGVENNMAGRAIQWQLPVGLQILFAGLLALGIFTLKESVRWLAKKGRHDEAWESLKWIRASDSEETAEELRDIQAAILLEKQETEGLTLKEFMQPHNAKRFVGGIVVFMAQQATGATAFAYYGPQYFSLLTGGSASQDLLLTAIFGAVKVFACGLFVWLAADRWGRKPNLTIGALGMAACQITTAAVLKARPVPSDGSIPPSSKATVAMIYLFVMVYNFSWGPLPWPYVNELFSSRYREVGVAAAVASQWLWNFVFTISTPYMIENMGWGTFLLWGLFDIVIAGGTFLFAHETKGLSLEAAAHPDVFGDRDTSLNDQQAKHLDDLRDDAAHGQGLRSRVTHARQSNSSRSDSADKTGERINETTVV